MATVVDTALRGDLQSTNASIWNRLPYNTGMDFHYCYKNLYTTASTVAFAGENTFGGCQFQRFTQDTTAQLPFPPKQENWEESLSLFQSNTKRDDNQGLTRKYLLHSTHHQQQQHSNSILALNFNDTQKGRDLNNVKSITTLLEDQNKSDLISAAVEQQSPSDSNLLQTSDVVTRLNDDGAEDNRQTCAKKFPVDNRISNKKNLVVKFNEAQSATVRRKTPSSPPTAGIVAANVAAVAVTSQEIANIRPSRGLASGISVRCCDFIGINCNSDILTKTTTRTDTSMSTSTTESTAPAPTPGTIVGSASDRLNCCPTAETTSSTLAIIPAMAVVSSMLLTDVLRKIRITIRKDGRTMTTAAALYLILYIFTSTMTTAARQDASNCTFPQRWEGSWFLSGYQQSIHIKGSQFSYRGKCAASDGNKYLIVDEKGCHRCLVIYEKHKNVLQYKESECEGDSMYMHQSNPSAMAMRSILKSDHRGGAHPNLNVHSRLSSSDQYIMRSNDDMNDCPPDFCKGRETLQNLCDQIPGDALLYSLFRENAEPVKCPLKGPFIFTYNRGHGECKSPVSNIESCTEDSRLLLSFQACPDVQGTESTVEELTCLATWKDGNSRYLVGLVSHHHAISNEERYRCFVYEKFSSLMGGPGMMSPKDAEYKLAQSGDATCNGLDSAEVGSRIMSLRKPPPAERCDFPAWFKGPRHWHALMGNSVYNFHPNDGSMHIIKPNGYMETRALCEQINKQTATEMMAVVHYTTGCQSGFMCMIFYRRDTHVIEIQTGKQASRLEDACAPDHFDINKMPYITLLASNPDPQICPLEGLYYLRGAIGPPYISSRHKRNHNNNKGHNSHGHHHHDVAHKRHTTSSFHITEDQSHASGYSNVKGLPTRNRRAVESPASTELSIEKPPRSEASDKAPTSSSVLSVDTIERNNLNPETDDDTTSSLLLKLNHDNIESGGIATATDGTGTNELIATKTQVHSKYGKLQRQEYKDSMVNGIINSGNSSRRNSNTSTGVEGAVSKIGEKNETIRTLPQRSRRDAPGCIVNYKAQRQLWIGCTGPNLIDVRPLCNEDGDEEYSCHGSWTENGTVYVIARHKGTKHGVCISYRPLEGTAAKLVIGDACYRGVLKPPEHHLVANLTVLGKCGDTSSALTIHSSSMLWIRLSLILFCIILPIQMFTKR